MGQKTIGRLLILLGLALIGGTVFLCIIRCIKLEEVFKVLGIVLAFEFFVYKLLTGWLISNLNVKIEPERKWLGESRDHLAIKLTLSKGGIDSVWLKDIHIKVTEVNVDDPSKNKVLKEVKPLNYEKRSLDNPDDIFNGSEIKSRYTISINEEVSFSSYQSVESGKVITIEVLVLGTRLFYGIESSSRTEQAIQWRASAIVLPAKNGFEG